MNDEQKNGQETLNQQQIHELVGRRINEFRCRNWEDDISRNSLDNEPFENLPPISEFRHELEQLKNESISAEQILQFAEKDIAPIPCAADREGYSANLNSRYWLTGLQDFLKITSAAQERAIDIDRFFDFGCATGRVLRHFVAQTNIQELWGSDINARHIRWLCEFMPPTVKPLANHCVPQLPIADHYFDVVSAFSVFTHIDTFETCWLAELKRILRPGGMAYLTIHNEDTWELLRAEIDNPANRLVQSMRTVDPETPQKLLQPMPSGRTVYRLTHLGPYRAQVFHSNSYIKNVWGRFFDSVEIIPRHHVRQTVVILR